MFFIFVIIYLIFLQPFARNVMVCLLFPHVFFKIVMFKHDAFDPTYNYITHYALDRYQYVVNHLRVYPSKLSYTIVLPFSSGIIDLVLFLG